MPHPCRLLAVAALVSVASSRLGPIIRSPSAEYAGSVSPASPGTWQPHPFYAGEAIFSAAPPGLILSIRLNESSTNSSPHLLADLRCVVDSRAVLTADRSADGASCDLSFLSFGGMHSVAAYAVHSDARGASLIGAPLFFRVEDSEPGAAPEDPVSAAAAAAQRLTSSEARLRAASPNTTAALVGVYYTTYQQYTSQLYQNVSRALGTPPITMDDVLSNASLHFADSIWKYYPGGIDPTNNYMSHAPALGIYCYYRKRANESSGPIADCPEASHVLQSHAAELTAAGFTFIAPDATNWDADPRNASNGADFNQLRPTEIIAEEWANMRLRGEATPQLSTFDQVDAGGVLFNWYLSEFFNNETLLSLDLILRTPDTARVPGSRKVYIVADEPTLDYPTVRAIQGSGGDGGIVTPIMWSAPDPSGNYEANGYLKYFSPCTAAVNGSRAFSSDAFLDADVPCGHLKTPTSPIGAVWTVSSGLPMNSMPFCPGVKLNGLFLKKQFYDVFADPTPTDAFFAPSWNEFAANAHPMAGWDMDNPFFYATGAQPDDPQRSVLVYDGFSSERSRTIEPSAVDGGYYYELFASCLRVYRLQASLGLVSSGVGCDVAGEECCVAHADEAFVRVHSLELPSGGGPVDALLTPDGAEAAALVSQGWARLCVPAIGVSESPTGICANASLPWAGPDFAAVRGPLLLYANTTGAAVPGATPLVRCVVDGNPPRHFVDSSAACRGGTGRPELVLGYGAGSRDGLFAREVRRCAAAAAAAAGRWYSVANSPCAEGDVDEGIVGYSI